MTTPGGVPSAHFIDSAPRRSGSRPIDQRIDLAHLIIR